MAIQMRRGYRKDFDPSKMLPGEWAVSIDASTSNQIVWMCFAPGVTKRMGTWEDLEAELDPYKEACEAYSDSAKDSSDKASVSESNAKKSETNAKVSETNAKASEVKAKEYMEKAFSGTPSGYSSLVDNVSAVNDTLSDLQYNETHGGKNLLNAKEMCEYWGIGYDNDGGINYNGYTKKHPYNKPYRFCDEAENLTLSIGTLQKGTANNFRIGLCEIKSDGTISYIAYINQSNGSITRKANAIYLDWSSSGTATISHIMLSKVSAPYEPFIPSVKTLAEETEQINTNLYDEMMLGWRVPKECPIQNEVSGNQFIQKVGRVDLGSLEWIYHSSGNFYTDNAVDNKLQSLALLCNKYFNASAKDITGVANLTTDKSISFQYNLAKRLIVRDTSYTDATAFKNANKGVYLYYELATPITYTIDGNEALSKVNASLSDEWTSKTYSVGDYCIYKNSMWRCLVANSVEPSEGSNWTKVTIGSELKRIIAMIK